MLPRKVQSDDEKIISILLCGQEMSPNAVIDVFKAMQRMCFKVQRHMQKLLSPVLFERKISKIIGLHNCKAITLQDVCL